MAKMRVLLAYSGGLDTSIIVPWLKENYDCDVVCVAGDVGQGEELEPLHEKAKKCGAEKLYIEDLRKEFVEDFIWPTLKAGAVYEGKYLLGTSFARPLIAKRLVEIAHKEGIDAVIQPGGSVRDQESIDYCNANGMAMVFTGLRHFKH